MNPQKLFSFNFKEILIDEIALSGLEGIGLDLLWRRVEIRFSSPITLKLKIRLWNFIINCESLSFYDLKQPVPIINILDRFSTIDEVSGHLLDPPEYLDGPYEYHTVENEYGSCANYNTRKLIKREVISSMSYEEVINVYGKTLVIVASLEERWKALVPHLPITYLNRLTPVHYCILELVGRGRENGQMTVGKTNLTKIVNESKLLFYNRRHLEKLDLIKEQHTTQVNGGKSMKCILLRLKKFHKPPILSLPKIGTVCNIVQYLREKPDFSEKTETMIKKGFMTAQLSKRFQKTSNFFQYEDREVSIDGYQKSRNGKQKQTVKKRFIKLHLLSDSDSQSDDEHNKTPLKCEYKVGVSLMRQAYERFLEAGLKGLTQIEVAQLLGVEFYTIRTICRILKSRHLIREFFEDRGRQRVSRYVASAAREEMDKTYEEEKKKFLQHVNDVKSDVTNNLDNANKRKNDDSDDIDSISKIPKKKAKMQEENKDAAVIELSQIDGLKNTNHESLIKAKKPPTLRQLKFANGIFKVIKEKQCVMGFQALNTIVSKEIGEQPMDTKALKVFIQRLIIDGQLKVIKIKWPRFEDKFSFVICGPNCKLTDPVIKAKYKEICTKVPKNALKKPKTREPITRPLSQFIYPRYLKIQKLHKLITELVYFKEISNEHFPPGFVTLFSIIPEMTVEFALGNISTIDVPEIANLKLDEESLSTKLKDAPQNIYRIITQCKSFINSIRMSLKILAVLGLIQIIEKPSESFGHQLSIISYVFYVNRRAKILDTSGKWPREDDLKSLEKSFYFSACVDVDEYWEEVMTISCNTTIIVARPESYKLVFPPRSELTVQEFDTGERYGDGLGPCGFDSSIYMDIPRLWRTFTARTQRKPTKTKKTINTVKIKPKPSKATIVKSKTKSNATFSDQIDGKSSAKLGPKVNAKSVPKPKPTKKSIANSKIKTENMYKIPIPRKRNRTPVDNTIKWTNFDDRILMMCKVAMAIISPVSQPGCLRVRNLVAKDLLMLYDQQKTASMCHLRASYLETKSLLTHEKDCILSELRRRRHLIKDYDGLLKILKSRCSTTNNCKFVNDARLPMLELITVITQIIKMKSFGQKVPCIAMDIEDFYKKYTISTKPQISPYRTSSNNELEFGAVKEGIIQSVMLSYENKPNKDTAKKIYSVFKGYSEKVLRTAIDQLRKGGIIVAREKSSNNLLNTVDFEDIIQSAYRISAWYQRKWNKLVYEFLDGLSNNLDSEIPQNGLKGRADLNCLFCEMISCDVLEIVSDTVPVVTGAMGTAAQEEQMNMIDIETKYALKSGLIGWKNKRNIRKFSELYQNFTCEPFFDAMLKESFVSSKINYPSVDNNDQLLSFIESTGFKGCTFRELQEYLGIETKKLQEKLTELEAAEIIKRIGYFENKIMLMKFAKSRLLQVEQFAHMIPAPWMDLSGKVRRDIFCNWATVIMYKIFECPGYSIANLSDVYDCISTRNIQDICHFLQKSECVVLKTIFKTEVDLFSTDDDTVQEFLDFNPFEAPENIFVFPVKNYLSRYSYIRKVILQDK